MNFETFVLEILDLVSWPVAVVIVAWLFRKPIYGLIPLTRKLKFKDFEMEFSEEVREVKRQSEESFPVPDVEENQLLENKKEYFPLLDISPRTAVLLAWNELHSAMSDNIKRHGFVLYGGILHGYLDLGYVLLSQGIINKNQYELVKKLSSLRSKLDHAEEFELRRKDAEYYIESTALLVTHLRTN